MASVEIRMIRTRHERIMGPMGYVPKPSTLNPKPYGVFGTKPFNPISLLWQTGNTTPTSSTLNPQTPYLKSKTPNRKPSCKGKETLNKNSKPYIPNPSKTSACRWHASLAAPFWLSGPSAMEWLGLRGFWFAAWGLGFRGLGV